MEVSGKLRQLAYEKGPEAKLPTVRQLCDTFGTSVATLDNALEELEQQRIIYRIQGSGIYVSPRVHYRHIAIVLEVGFFQNVVASPYWGMLWGLFITRSQERSATRHEEFSFHLVSSWDINQPDLPAPLVEMVESGRTAGVIGIGITEPTAKWLRDHATYVSYAGPAGYEIFGDGNTGIRLGVEALAGQGCRNIGLWTPVETNRLHSPDLSEKDQEFQIALEKAGLPYNPEFSRDNAEIICRANTITRQNLQEQGYTAAMEIFGGSDRSRHPDGLIIGDDMMTSGALAAFQALGIRPGADVQIVSQANRDSPILFGYENVLTRLMYEPAECVERLFDILGQLMDGSANVPPITYLRPIVVPPGNMPSPVTHPFIEDR